MKHCKWCGIFLILGFLTFIVQPGYAVTDTVYFSINGDTTAFSAVQGDSIGWMANCEVGATVGWEIYLDLDSSESIDIPGDKLLFTFSVTDGDINGSNGPADNNSTPDGMIIISPMLLGFSPGYYIFKATDLSDYTTAQNWMSMEEIPTPPNMFTGWVTISGISAPDDMLKNIWVLAENEDGGEQMWSGLTNDSGYYEINVGNSGTGVEFRISPENIEGFVTPSEQYETASGQIDDINFEYVTPADSIYGNLVDEDDNPITAGYAWASPNFSGPDNKDYSITDGSYVFYFGASELGVWNVGISTEGLFPVYMSPQSFQYDNSVEQGVNHDFTAYLADTAIYVLVTEAGAEPSNSYKIQASSSILGCYSEGISGTGSSNLLTLYVSSKDSFDYQVQVATWDDDYPIPPGFIVEEGTVYNVSPGDTIEFNLIAGVMVRDTITVSLPNPGVNWDNVWVSLWSLEKSYGGTPDNNGVFTLYADTGAYSLSVFTNRYFALPSSREIHLTGDTTGGMGFTLNYANCHVTGHITGLTLPLDSGLMVSAQSGVGSDQYNTSGEIDGTTGEFSLYVCDGDWIFYPPTINNAQSPSSHSATVSDDDTLLTFDFEYQSRFLVCDTIKVDAGDPAITMTNVQVTLSGPGGYFSGYPNSEGVFNIYVDTGSYGMTAFYNGYLASPNAYNIHVTGDTCGGLGYTLNYIDIHISGYLIGLSLPLYSNSLHVNAETDEWPVGYHTTSITIDSITGGYNIYVCDGNWTFTAPDIPGYYSPSTWNVSFTEDDNADTHDFSYTSSGVDTKTPAVPKDFALSQNSPNPFNSSTRIEFALPNKAQVELDIYNMLGQKVRTLVTGEYTAGYYSAIWDGANQAGHSVATGIYLYRLVAGDKVMIKKMVVLK